MSGQVTALDGSRPVGTVSILVDGEVVATEPIEARDQGRFIVKLPKLPAGPHWVQTVFGGGDGFAGSQSVPAVVVLW